MQQQDDKERLVATQAQIKAIASNLAKSNEQMESYLSDEVEESEFQKVIEYDLKIAAISSKIETYLKKETEGMLAAPAQAQGIESASRATHGAQDSTELVKLPKLEMIKFSGNSLEWTRFWTQYESAVHVRPNMSNGQKFNYLMSTLTGKAAAAIEGLQFSAETNYEQAIKILKETFGRHEQLVDLHMKELLRLDKVTSVHHTEALRKLFQRVQIHTLALQSLGVNTECYAPMLMPGLKRAMPAELLIQFKTKEASETRSSADSQETTSSMAKKSADALQRMIQFLREQVCLREEAQREQETAAVGPKQESKKLYSTTASFYSSAHKACLFCKQTNHPTEECTRSIPMEEKKKLLAENRYCFRCTRPNHTARICKANVLCKRCRGRHATSICKTKNTKRQEPNTVRQTETLMQSVGNQTRNCVLLPTAIAWVQGEASEDICRVLLDSGSQRTFITTSLAEQIGAKTLRQERLRIGSFGGNEKLQSMDVVKVTVKSLEKDSAIAVEALKVGSICHSHLPAPDGNIRDKMRELKLKLADDAFETKGVGITGLLIGSDYYWEFVTGQTRHIENRLVAAETTLGWIVHGPVSENKIRLKETQTAMVLEVEATNVELKMELERFWSLEAIGIEAKTSQRNRGNMVAEKFKEQVVKENGRYKVNLPWKENIDMQNNKNTAMHRLIQLTRRLNKNEKLLERYDKAISEYFSSGVAEKVSENSGYESNLCYYMPHQAVIREDRETTKVRVVFDASSSSIKGRSLNDNLEAGPNFNEDMLSLLLNFRKEKVALVGDVEKAFLQIAIHEDDRDALRFLWWKHDAEGGLTNEVETWRMTRVTFGTTPSTFLLAATIQHHLGQMKDEFPMTTKKLMKGIYVDDVIFGADTVEEAVKLYKESKEIFRRASMNLRKWTSNEEKLNQILDEHEKDTAHQETRLKGDTTILGMRWKHSEDMLSFPVEKWMTQTTTNNLTKRAVLQATSKIFDPIGLLSPFTIRIKIGFQRLWKMGVTWDDPLPSAESDQWRKLIEESERLKRLKVQRCYVNKEKDIESRHLHVFSDASPSAYGAAAYIVHKFKDKTMEATLMMAKSRVAPMKELSLAKLELLAAVLAARLSEYITKHYAENFESVSCWTDSMITLHWVKGDGRREAFVKRRVDEIRERTKQRSWGFVQGEENPADMLTRGISSKSLIQSAVWWHGPSFIKSEEQRLNNEANVDLNTEAERETVQCNELSAEQGTPPIINIERYGTFNKLLRVTAWMFRFIENTKRRRTKGALTADEMTKAEAHWVKETQKCFTPFLINRGSNLDRGFQLHGKEVYLDDANILRHKGRLQFSALRNRHVIVLPKNARFTELLIRHVHNLVLHGGVQETLTRLRTKFWVIQGRQAVKQIISKCITCKRHNARHVDQPVPPLPEDRVNEAKPFEVIGVDFTGKLYATYKGQQVQQYVLIFTCAVTRAVHLELTDDSTTNSFLQAFRRFVARRGLPEVIYSDNAKTFKRAEREINKSVEASMNDPLSSYSSMHKIKWKAIAECAPWWGGFYERLIRSMKTSIRKVIAKRITSLEELRTVVAEVEGALNNRPLTYVYGEPDEPLPLTPAGIIGGKIQLQDTPGNQHSSDIEDAWRSRCRITQEWWARWRDEYLKELGATVRARAASSKQLSEGDVVLIEDKGPRTFWRMCRIERTYTGRDGRIRSCLLPSSGKELLQR